MKTISLVGKHGKINGHLHLKTKKEVVLIVHGFSSNNRGGAKDKSLILESIGVSSFRIDLDDRGGSELSFEKEACISSYVDQVNTCIDYLKKEGFEKVSLLGTSFGGIVVLVAAQNKDINKIFLRCPVLDAHERFLAKYSEEDLAKYESEGRVPKETYEGDIIYFSYNLIEDAKKYDPKEYAKNISAPVRIVHGTEDELVSIKHIEKRLGFFEKIELVKIEGAGHRLDVDGSWEVEDSFLKDFFGES